MFWFKIHNFIRNRLYDLSITYYVHGNGSFYKYKNEMSIKDVIFVLIYYFKLVKIK